MDHYFVLGIDKKSTQEEIKKAYRSLAKKYHPDKGGNSEKFQEIAASYEILKNSNLRSEYDGVLNSNILRHINLRFVSFSPKIIPVKITLHDVFYGAEKTISSRVPCFFDADDNQHPSKVAILKCKFCYLADECSICAGTRRIISDKIYCREHEREIQICISPRKGIYNGKKIDMGAYIILFQIADFPNVQLNRYDITLSVEIPLEQFILCEPFEIDSYEKLVFCCSGKNLNTRYIYPGRGLYKSMIERGDLVIMPQFAPSDKLKEMITPSGQKYDAEVLYIV